MSGSDAMSASFSPRFGTRTASTFGLATRGFFGSTRSIHTHAMPFGLAPRPPATENAKRSASSVVSGSLAMTRRTSARLAITPCCRTPLGSAFTGRLHAPLHYGRCVVGSPPARLLVRVDAEAELADNLVRHQRVAGVDATEPGVTEQLLHAAAGEDARTAG